MWSELKEIIAVAAIVEGYLLLAVSLVVRGRTLKKGRINSCVADVVAGVGIVMLIGGIMSFLP